MKKTIEKRFVFLPTVDGFFLLTGDKMMMLSNAHLSLQERAHSFIRCFPLSYFIVSR